MDNDGAEEAEVAGMAKVAVAKTRACITDVGGVDLYCVTCRLMGVGALFYDGARARRRALGRAAEEGSGAVVRVAWVVGQYLRVIGEVADTARHMVARVDEDAARARLSS